MRRANESFQSWHTPLHAFLDEFSLLSEKSPAPPPGFAVGGKARSFFVFLARFRSQVFPWLKLKMASKKKGQRSLLSGGNHRLKSEGVD